MRSDNLQLPCVQPQTSSYNFQPPHGHHGHGGDGGHVGHVVGVVNMMEMVVRAGQDGTGRDGTGRDGTGRAKLTFKFDFPGYL